MSPGDRTRASSSSPRGLGIVSQVNGCLWEGGGQHANWCWPGDHSRLPPHPGAVLGLQVPSECPAQSHVTRRHFTGIHRPLCPSANVRLESKEQQPPGRGSGVLIPLAPASFLQGRGLCQLCPVLLLLSLSKSCCPSGPRGGQYQGAPEFQTYQNHWTWPGLRMLWKCRSVSRGTWRVEHPLPCPRCLPCC